MTSKNMSLVSCANEEVHVMSQLPNPNTPNTNIVLRYPIVFTENSHSFLLLFHCIALKISKLLVATFRFYKSQQQQYASILSEQQTWLLFQLEWFPRTICFNFVFTFNFFKVRLRFLDVRLRFGFHASSSKMEMELFS